MHTQYYKEYSHCLQRDMEFKVYGHAGLPLSFSPARMASISILRAAV